MLDSLSENRYFNVFRGRCTQRMAFLHVQAASRVDVGALRPRRRRPLLGGGLLRIRRGRWLGARQPSHWHGRQVSRASCTGPDMWTEMVEFC